VIEVPIVRPVSPLRDARALWQLLRALRATECDILHTHASKSGLLGRLAARLTGRRAVVHTPHAFYFQGKRGAARRFFRALEKAALRWTARLILLSPMQAELAQRELGAPEALCAVIENGVDADLFSPAESPSEARHAIGLEGEGPVVGTLTRFLPQKATDVLLRAWARLFRLEPACRGVIVGHEGDRAGARALARDLGIDARIYWVERTAEPWTFYRAMDLFMLASRYEGMPYTLLEAMACATPVVATRIPGCIEALGEEAGRLVAPEDPEALAGAALELLRAPALARAMGRAGRERILRRFTVRRFLAQTEQLYESLAVQGPLPSSPPDKAGRRTA